MTYKLLKGELSAHLDPDLVRLFFTAFSRAEYALKASGFVINVRGYASPDWKTFSQAIDDNFGQLCTTDADLAASVTYLTAEPPKTQTCDSAPPKNLRWSDDTGPAPRDTKSVLQSMKTIRNNLFHGGKALPISKADRNRDNALIGHALVVLDRALTCNTEVQAMFAEEE